MNIVSYDGRVKRWHSKVLHAAESKACNVLQSLGLESLGDFFTECDNDTCAIPALVVKQNDQRQMLIMRFNTHSWTSVDQAIPDAFAQLLSILAAFTRSSELALQASECTPNAYIANVVKLRIPDDPNAHSTIYLRDPLERERFLQLVEQLETELHIAGVGDVEGTGWSIDGTWSIDICGPDSSHYNNVVTELLNSRSISHRIEKHG